MDVTNEDRADYALEAVKAFAAQTGQDQYDLTVAALLDLDTGIGMRVVSIGQEVIGDLLCDLMHLCGDQFEEFLRAGRMHYEAEVCKECGGTAEDDGICFDCWEKKNKPTTNEEDK